jgi:hypothetical protein
VVGISYIWVNIHAFLSVCAVGEELAVFLRVEEGASLFGLSAIREVLAPYFLLLT